LIPSAIGCKFKKTTSVQIQRVNLKNISPDSLWILSLFIRKTGNGKKNFNLTLTGP